MPRTRRIANALETVRGRLASPAWFAAAVSCAYLLLVLPMLVRHHFDPSVFIVAGDRYVHAGQTPSPILVRSHSDGYDGQFYYRLALTPWLGEATADGVTLDHPAWRMQRILLPLLARAVALGNPAAIPAALFAVNFCGIFVIAWLAMYLARRHGFPAVVPLAIVAWPGFLIALTHDTTEILAAAWMLAAITALLAEQAAVYAGYMALATLARETPVLAALGFFAVGSWDFTKRRGQRPLWLGAAMVPFVAWREVVASIWHDAPQAHGVAHNAGWPLVGWTQALLANGLNRLIGAAPAPRGLVARATMLVSLGGAVVFCAWLVPVAVRQLRANRDAGLAAAWTLVLALMAVLTSNGPLIDATAFFRAFTECWVLGWLVAASVAMPAVPRWLLVVAAPILIRIWGLCWIQVR